MAYRNLDEFLVRLEQNSELIRIQHPIHASKDIMAITQEAMRQPDADNKALWFENVLDTHFPVVTNLFGTERRMAWALGLESLTDLRERAQQLIAMGHPAGLTTMLGRAGEMMSMIRSAGIGRTSSIIPREFLTLRDSDVNLSHLPILHQWNDEPHQSLTNVPVIIKTCDDKSQRVFFTSAFMYGSQTLGICIDDEALRFAGTDIVSIAVILGGDPAFTWASSLHLPTGINPLWVAGWLRNRPIPTTLGTSQKLTLPANAEIILEGWADPNLATSIGPIAGDDGFYIDESRGLTMHVTTMHYRQEAVFPAVITTPESRELYWMSVAAENLFSPLAQVLMDEINLISLPAAGVGTNLLIASINKQAMGQAHKVIYGLLGMGQLARCKTVVIVDHDVNPHDLAAVGAAIITNVNQAHDIIRLPGEMSSNDSTLAQRGFGIKLGIDATRKTTHDSVSVDDDTWSDFIKVIAVDSAQTDIQDMIQQIYRDHPNRHIILVEPEFAMYNLSDLLRVVLASVDWERDLWIFNDGQLRSVIDATRTHKNLTSPLKSHELILK